MHDCSMIVVVGAKTEQGSLHCILQLIHPSPRNLRAKATPFESEGKSS
jgi:hypothetical protein